jgi:CDP-diacylglycerol--serine O-phosphatidyltransferase
MNDLPPGQPPKDAAPGAGQPSGPRALKPRFRRRMRRRPRYKGPSFNRLVPNIMTLLGLCAGLTSIRYAIDGRFGAAAVAIAVAGLIDGLDGRLARLLKAVTRFGAEFDSLSDFLCFGVAPSFVMYLWSLHTADGFGFMPCLMFSVCMALRLARFNAALDSGPGPAFAYNFFTGVPAPAGAGLALLPLFVGLEARSIRWDWLFRTANHPLVVAVALAGTAVLLVSSLPVWSFKNFKVPAEYVLPVLLGIGTFTALLVADPWAAMAILGVAYLAMLPFSRRSFHRLRREAAELEDPLQTPDDRVA